MGTAPPHATGPARLFRGRAVSVGLLVMLVLYCAMGAFFVLTLYLQDGLGYSPLKTALTMLPATVGVVQLGAAAGPATVGTLFFGVLASSGFADATRASLVLGSCLFAGAFLVCFLLPRGSLHA